MYHLYCQTSTKLLFVMALSAFFYFQCTTTQTTGVTDLPNEKISGTVIFKNNLQTAATPVTLRKILLTDHGDSIITEAATTSDVLGRFSFENIAVGTYTLFASDSITQSSAVISKLIKETSELSNVNVFLDKNVTIVGRIRSSSTDELPHQIFIPGSDIATVPDSEGIYCLNNVPPGQYDIGFIYNDKVNFLSIKTTGNVDTIFIRDAGFDDTSNTQFTFFESNTNNIFSIAPKVYSQNPTWYTGKDFYAASYYTIKNNLLVEIDGSGHPALLLDNFNDNDIFTELYTVFPDIIWYGWNDANSGCASNVFPDINYPNNFSRCIEPFAGMGKVAHVKFLLANDCQYPFAGIGCKNNTNERQYINLSLMSSISFYIKGKGTLSVTFSSKKVDDFPEPDNWGDLQKSFTLPEEWEQVTINVADLKPPPYSLQDTLGLQWKDVCDSIRSFHFESVESLPGDTIEFWLDNIFLNGISKSDLQ